MMITIELDKEKAEFLKKILEKVLQGRSEFTRSTGDGGREYLVSLEEIPFFEETLTDVIKFISRGIKKKDFQENEAGIHRELMGAVRQSGSAAGYCADHIDDFKESLQRGIKTVSDGLRDLEPLTEEKGLPPLGHDRPMPPVKKPKPPKGRMKKF